MSKLKGKCSKKIDKVTQKEVDPVLKGYKKWCREYILSAPPPVHELQKEINDFMEQYDRQLEEEKKKSMEVDGVPDEEGWVTVTSGKTKVAHKADDQNSRKDQMNKKFKKKKELVNFYGWQEKQAKNQHILDLQERLKSEKERIAQMRASRKFKPY